MSASNSHLVVGVQAGLGEGVQALAGHHARDRREGAVHLAQLRQEECRTKEPDLQEK